MTFREVYEGTDKLSVRRMLTEDEVRDRLSNYYNTADIDDCIHSVKLCECWNDPDGQVAVVYNSSTDKYIIIATGKHIELIV